MQLCRCDVSLGQSQWEFHERFREHYLSCHITNFAYVAMLLWGKRRESFIICERSFIVMKLLWRSYLVSSLGTHAMKLCTKTGLRFQEMLSSRSWCSCVSEASSQRLTSCRRCAVVNPSEGWDL
jgi:hypothetical protein